MGRWLRVYLVAWVRVPAWLGGWADGWKLDGLVGWLFGWLVDWLMDGWVDGWMVGMGFLSRGILIYKSKIKSEL